MPRYAVYRRKILPRTRVSKARAIYSRLDNRTFKTFKGAVNHKKKDGRINLYVGQT